MRGQYSLEAILIAASFFILIGLFTGIYSRFISIESSAGLKARMERELDLIVFNVNNAYYLGDGNEFKIETKTDSSLTYRKNQLILSNKNLNTSKKVIPEIKILSFSKDSRIYNSNGTIFIESAE